MYVPYYKYNQSADEKGDIDKMIEYAGKDIKHVHCADGYKSFRFIANPDWRVHMHLIPGFGEIDIRQTLRCLNKIDYKGYISLNLFAHIDHPLAAILMAWDRIKDYCNESGIHIE